MMAIISSLIYVALTYTKKEWRDYYYYPDLILCFIFLIEYIVGLYVAQHKLGFILLVSSNGMLLVALPCLALYSI